MSRKTIAGDRRRRKTITGLWVLGISAVIIFLIYKEMSAVLYILATLGVTVLLLMVAFSDLAHTDGVDQTGPKDVQGATNKLT